MTGSLRIVLVRACALCAVAMGCRQNTPLPTPDAMRAGGLTLAATPGTLTIRPASSGRIEFQLRDEQDQPVPDYPVDFAIVRESSDGATVQARLSTDRGLTNRNGSAVLEVISDSLDTDSRAVFLVTATSQGCSSGTSVEVTVTTNAYQVAIVPMAAEDIIHSSTIARTQLFFYDNTACSAIDLAKLSTAPTRPRTPRDIEPGGSCVVQGVSGQGSHAVVGMGYDVGNVLRGAGCLDLPGSSLLEKQTVTATLLLDRMLPVPTDSYQVATDIRIPLPAPQPVAAILAAWQEWSRCPMDPARLWLDCTVDSLVTNGSNDPNDCVPVAGGEGPLGAQLEARRGTALQSTTVTGKRPPTSCRDKIDSNGKSSLEAIVDALFDSSRSPLDAKNLSGFPDEIATLLSAFHLNSTMGIAADKQPNSYIIDHALVDISFPQSSTLLLKATTLGLAVPSAHGVLASVQYGYLKIPPHWFTLRLGTAARYAFEDSSLQKARGMTDATQLINAVFGLARLSDRGRLLTGCDALDAALCDQVKESRGCLLGACRTGLVALAQKLSGAFDSLDGDGLDFYLTGSAPLADSNGDGRADSLGLVRSSTGLAASGLWVGQILSGAGSCGVSGSWAASSVAAP